MSITLKTDLSLSGLNCRLFQLFRVLNVFFFGKTVYREKKNKKYLQI